MSKILPILDIKNTNHEMEYGLSTYSFQADMLAVSANSAECAQFRRESQRVMRLLATDSGRAKALEEIHSAYEVGVVLNQGATEAAAVVRPDVTVTDADGEEVASGSIIELWRQPKSLVGYSELGAWAIEKALEHAPDSSVLIFERSLGPEEIIKKRQKFLGRYYDQKIHDAVIAPFDNTPSGFFKRSDMWGAKPMHGTLGIIAPH